MSGGTSPSADAVVRLAIAALATALCACTYDWNVGASGAADAGESAYPCDGSQCGGNCNLGHCGLTCGAGETCSGACSGGNCNYDCTAGSTCDLSCSGGGCSVTCEPGATCNVSCSGAGCQLSCEGTCIPSCLPDDCTCSGPTCP